MSEFYTAEVPGRGNRAVIVAVEEPDWNTDSDPRKMLKWSKTAGKMSGNQKRKIVQLVAHNCIQYAGGSVFVSLPLDTHSEVLYQGKVYKKIPCEVDYNKDPAPYEVRKLWGDEFECTCQWNQKMNLTCTHIAALKIEFKRKKFGRKDNGHN